MASLGTQAAADGLMVVQVGKSAEKKKALFDVIRDPKHMEAGAAEQLKKLALERRSTALAAAMVARRTYQHHSD